METIGQRFRPPLAQAGVEAAEGAARGRRLPGLDAMRIVGFVAVVTLHCVRVRDFDAPDALHHKPELTLLIMLSCRFAVPYFFLLSGYLAGFREVAAAPAIAAAVRRIVPLYVVWTAIYLALAGFTGRGPVGFDALDIALNGGPGFQLWFLPALLLNLVILHLLKHVLPLRWLLLLGLAIYLGGSVLGSLTAESPSLSMAVRDGPTFGLMFVIAGYAIAVAKLEARRGLALLLIAVGAALQLTEAVVFINLGMQTISDQYYINFGLGTLPYGLGFFLLALSFRGEGRAMTTLGRIGAFTLGYYCIHVAFIWMFRGLFGWYSFPQEILLTACTAAASIASVLILSRLRVLLPLLR